MTGLTGSDAGSEWAKSDNNVHFKRWCWQSFIWCLLSIHIRAKSKCIPNTYFTIISRTWVKRKKWNWYTFLHNLELVSILKWNISLNLIWYYMSTYFTELKLNSVLPGRCRFSTPVNLAKYCAFHVSICFDRYQTCKINIFWHTLILSNNVLESVMSWLQKS